MARSRQPPRKADVEKLLGRLAAEEQQFLKQEFLAPVVRGGEIRVRIAGVVCKVHVRPRNYTGWGIFQPVSHTQARLVRPASMAERRGYLELFPLMRLLVCRLSRGECLCCAASFGDQRFQIDGLVPVELADAIQVFDAVQSRFDGARFWFDGLDARHNPATAAYLRGALAEHVAPELLDRPGLTAEERAVYELNYWELAWPADGESRPQPPDENMRQRRRRRLKDAARESPPEDPVRQRLRESLSHAGAQLVEYLERADSFRVTYSVGGRQYTSAVDKADLTVQVANICLSGEDRKFDLGSLVGVLHEADDDGRIVAVGGQQRMNEEAYWHAHPPRNR